ncbi:MAG: hypothetical protein A2Z11_03025 [Candidatus Woykebacteria bacterium RBG_16_43_9]|uniref:Uncharacterized protein n=1 Tax=Candidatus Woykebacteria bacterium RBG_16_43_9 TaxID=1802596 RepID=A0A1G1WC95_9BACT|nr:MAG: hypothetical protein A2Z11_03025 [Candidatus Woykebacteria bacterium RBG_16_43_9]
MDNLPAPPEGVDSQIEKEAEAPQPTSEDKGPSPITHEDHEAKRIEAAFGQTQERRRELKEEAHEEGKRLARQTWEEPQEPPPEREISKPITPIDKTDVHPPPKQPTVPTQEVHDVGLGNEAQTIATVRMNEILKERGIT